MTEKIRVYELARDMLVESKVIIKVLHEIGVPAKNHMSTMDGATRDKVVEILTTKARSGEAKMRESMHRDARKAGRTSSKPVVHKPPKARPEPSFVSGMPRAGRERGVSGAKPADSTPKSKKPGVEYPQSSAKTETWGAKVPKGKSLPPSMRRPYAPPGARKSPVHAERERAYSPRDVPGAPPSDSKVSVAKTKQEQVRTLDKGQKAVQKPDPSRGLSGKAEHERLGKGALEFKNRSAGTDRKAKETPPFAGQRREMISPAGRRVDQKGTSVITPSSTSTGAIHREEHDQYPAGGRGRKDTVAPRVPVGGAEAVRREPVPTRDMKREHKGKAADKGHRSKRFQERGFESRNERSDAVRKVKPDHAGKHARSGKPDRSKVIPIEERRPRKITLERPVTVSELARMVDLKSSDLIKRLVSLGIMASINQQLDLDTATLVSQELGYEVEQKTPEDRIAALLGEEPLRNLIPRPPVVTVMGHVDHGKTSLLDAIRNTRVAAGETGGITQHIGAYKAEWQGREITFIDTPGHEAFTAMRARGAKVTDIAVLVVAADDGVMPQTIEAVNHAKAAGVPIIVAINKIDKAGSSPERVMQSLSEIGLIPDDWGGDTVCVPVSAKQGTGIDKLLEMILLVADMQELKADFTVKTRGVVIEAKIDRGRGPVATVLVQNGILKEGNTFVAGSTWGKVRTMVDHRSKRVKKATPSTPVEVTGFNGVPGAGDVFSVVEDEKVAKEISSLRQSMKREESIQRSRPATLEDLTKEVREGDIKDLNLVIKGDVQGTVEAVKQTLENLGTEEVRTKVIHSGVGAINESDVMLAKASNAMIIGFNVKPDPNAKHAAEAEQVDIRSYSIIYDAIEDIRRSLRGMEEPKYREVMMGRVEVRAVFKSSKVGIIAGCYVTEGKVEKNSAAKVLRKGDVIFEGKVTSLRRFKDDVREVGAGYECGISMAKLQDIEEGDVIETYGTEEIKPGE
jgi:translation initiation factor IF-2